MAGYKRLPVHWMDDAACTKPGVNPAWFHPEINGAEVAEAAKHVCARCPVSAECDEDRRFTRESHGIQAGLTIRGVRKEEKAMTR